MALKLLTEIKCAIMKLFNLLKKNRREEYPAARELYEKLCAEKYTQNPYKKQSLHDDMSIIEETFFDYSQPRYLIDERNKTAVEFMNCCRMLQTVCTDDIDWESLSGMPENAIATAQALIATFRISVGWYKDGIAHVEWVLNPDGRYYMDEDGFGMTNDVEVSIHSFIDRNGKPLLKFRYEARFYYDHMLKKMGQEAREILKARR